MLKLVAVSLKSHVEKLPIPLLFFLEIYSLKKPGFVLRLFHILNFADMFSSA